MVDSDIVAQTSIKEQGAWASFEAVLCETPIIVTKDTGAGEDVFKYSAGELISYGDINGLSKLINDMLNNYEIYLEKTRKAKNFIEQNLSMEKCLIEYINLYTDTIRG